MMLLHLSFASCLHGIYFFHPLTFSLYVSLGLTWVSCRQHIYGPCFCTHSASLCLLVGAFNPFTFKVIIHIYVTIAIFNCWSVGDWQVEAVRPWTSKQQEEICHVQGQEQWLHFTGLAMWRYPMFKVSESPVRW